jgi:hypothetical protein
VTWAKKALSDPWNARSFPIWYHKAVSECMLKEFSECENSLTWASYYAGDETETYLEDVYRFLESTRNRV